MLPFLKSHFPSATFNGRVQLGCRGSRSVSIVPALTIDYASLSSALSSFYLSPRADYYISVNTFSGVSRHSSALFSFHNFVIDIDCHISLSPHERDFQISLLLWRLHHSIFHFPLVLPTSIVYTGRGLQLWWSITGISVKFQRIYQAVLEFYLQSIASCMTSSPFDDFSMFHVDFAASRNMVGYFRLPGTINTKTNTLVLWEKTGTTYNLMDLYNNIDTSPPSSLVFHQKPDTFDVTSFTSLAEQRVRAFESLRDLRSTSIGAEERNNFCFMVYNALVITYGHDHAYEVMSNFNKSFLQPLSKAELNNVISSAQKKGGYQYTNEKIIEFLHISPYESEKIGLTQGESPYLNKKSRTKLQNYTKKEQRNQKILDLFDQGQSMKHITETLNLSFPTVNKVLKDNNRKNKDERKEKIILLSSQGKKNQEIAASCGCSVRTVQRVLDSS